MSGQNSLNCEYKFEFHNPECQRRIIIVAKDCRLASSKQPCQSLNSTIFVIHIHSLGIHWDVHWMLRLCLDLAPNARIDWWPTRRMITKRMQRVEMMDTIICLFKFFILLFNPSGLVLKPFSCEDNWLIFDQLSLLFASV